MKCYTFMHERGHDYVYEGIVNKLQQVVHAQRGVATWVSSEWIVNLTL